MPAFAPVPLVQQQVLDALGAWVTRATGLLCYHGEQNSTKPTPPYVSIEWQEEPAPVSPRVVTEATGLPTSVVVTLSPAEEEWAAVAVNLAHPGLQRDAGEMLSDFADRWAAELAPMLSGRVTVARQGEADVLLTPVNVGDLWRVEAIEHASAVVGGTAGARVSSRVYSGVARVWVIGGQRTSGRAGDAGDGRGVMELVALLVEALAEDWCREMFDSYGVRCESPEPSPAGVGGRRSNAARETRAYIDIQIGVSARFGLPANPVEAVGCVVAVAPAGEDPGIVAAEVQVDLEA